MRHTPSLPTEQKEQARHGEHFFPLKKYVTILTGLHPSVTAHWHDEAEFTRITEGTCTYHVGPDTFEASVGDLLFLPPTVLHSISVTSDIKMVSETFVFHMNFLGAGSADICSIRYLMPITSRSMILPYIIKKEHPAYEDLLSLFCKINNVYDAGLPGYELMLKSLFLQVITLLLPYAGETSDRPQLETEHTAKLKLVLEFIDGHYTEELSIPQLARICYFSEYHFMRFFKKYVGISCIEYIKNRRLDHAASLLMQGDISIMDAALSSGFTNLSYFYREFRKKYNMTPKKFVEEKPSSFWMNKYIESSPDRPSQGGS